MKCHRAPRCSTSRARNCASASTRAATYRRGSPIPKSCRKCAAAIFLFYDAHSPPGSCCRMPTMLGVLGLLFATYKLGRYAFGESGGLYAGVVLATSLGLYIFTRFLIPDVLVGLWLTIGYYFFLRSLEEERPSRLSCWGFAATCALNVLT